MVDEDMIMKIREVKFELTTHLGETEKQPKLAIVTDVNEGD